MKISELGSGERPRERMLAHGPGPLSAAELVAILLRTGTKQENVLDISRKLMASCGESLTELSSRSIESLSAVKGVGKAKALSLSAAFELGRRMGEERFRMEKKTIRGAGDVYRMLGSRMKGLSKEECWCIFLNPSHYVIAREKLSTGDDVSTVMDACGIVRRALEHRCRKLILVHNHPSGNPMPGASDIARTEDLRRALAPFRIKLLDHIIVSDDSFYSFCEETVYPATK